MPLRDLDESDQALVRRSLELVLTSEDLWGEFQTRLGVSEDEVRALLDRWPQVDDRADDSVAFLAINNALNEVAHGIALTPTEAAALGADRATVRAVFQKWTRTRGWHGTGLR